VLLTFLFILLGATLMAVVFSLNAMFQTLRTGLPYVSTPQWAIDWLANNLYLTTADTFYEIGCGDARVVTALAHKFPAATFIGIEIQWWPFLLAKWRARNVPNLKIKRADVFRADMSDATTVFGFYITSFAPKIAAYLQKAVKLNTRIISFGFPLPGFTLEKDIPPPTKKGSHLLLYRADKAV
jgi:trans-aconitate methyltransferase